MLNKLMRVMQEEKTRDVAFAVGGMGAMLTGSKLVSLGLFAKGFQGLEKQWRERHPEFTGGWKERWKAAAEFYESTHQNPANRVLHMVGIPMIVGGAVGLLATPAFSPPWLLSAGSFAAGWALNIAGHTAFEKNAPAFAEDPLSFVAGPVWDLQQLRKGGLKAAFRKAAEPTAPASA